MHRLLLQHQVKPVPVGSKYLFLRKDLENKLGQLWFSLQR